MIFSNFTKKCKSYMFCLYFQCNENPCGLKYRSVSCEDPAIGCHKNEIPASEQACSNVTCGHWVTEDWVDVS